MQINSQHNKNYKNKTKEKTLLQLTFQRNHLICPRLQERNKVEEISYFIYKNYLHFNEACAFSVKPGIHN